MDTGIVVDIQVASEDEDHPPPSMFKSWIKSAIGTQLSNAEVSVRLVDIAEITQLNNTYRDKNKATNILSFPAELPEPVDLPLLGDLVICTPIVNQEALEQSKKPIDHWAHMTIHGTLHLLGYDHIDDEDAARMEALEIEILANLNISNPYITNDTALTL